MSFQEELRSFCPYNVQEQEDQRIMLDFLARYPELLFSRTSFAHFTVSAWIVNASRTRVLLIFHNIYQSWSWSGGHVPDSDDLIGFTVNKARQETNLQSVHPALDQIYSLEIVATNGYYHDDKYSPAHLHLNLTYLLEADEMEPIYTNEAESGGVKWFDLRRAAMLSNGTWIRSIYSKLNAKLESL